MDCPECHGRGVVKRPDGALARCACYWRTRSLRIATLLRQGETMLPDGWHALDVWPLADRQVIGGDYTAFRRQAWRSLLQHLEQDPTGRFSHVALAAGRAVEIYFGRDEEFRSYRDLLRPGLVILVCGVADINSSGFAAHVAEVVVKTREMEGLPTWVFATSKRAFGSAQYTEAQAKRAVDAPDDSGRRSRRADEPDPRKKPWRG